VRAAGSGDPRLAVHRLQGRIPRPGHPRLHRDEASLDRRVDAALSLSPLALHRARSESARRMNPRDFLNVAAALIAGPSEADWRTAGSRAYYAAFHVARNLLRQCGFVVPKADQAHAYLWLRLANCGHPDVTKAGDDLHDLRNVRNQADYDLEMLFPH